MLALKLSRHELIDVRMPSRRLLAALGAAAIVALVPSKARAAWPTLEDSVTRARTSALSVLEARGQVGVARSAMAGARVSVFSNPYAELQIQHGRADVGEFPAQINGFVFLPFDVHGQRGARIEEAEHLATWKSLGLADAQARAVGEVIATYGEVLVAAQRIGDALRAQEDAAREVDYFSQRLAVGDATIFEKSLAEAEAARWAQVLAEANVRAIETRMTLSQLTGLPAIDLPPADLTTMPPPLRTTFGPHTAAQLVETSPLLRALLAESRFWEASKERFSAEKNPPLNFIVNGGYGAVGEPRVGGGLAWTFPVTRRNQGEIARAEAERDRVLSFRDTARNVIEARVRGAYETLAVSVRAVAEQDKTGIPATQRVVDASLAAYKAGKGELLRVFIARRDLATAKARRLDLVSLSWRAYGALAALKGELP